MTAKHRFTSSLAALSTFTALAAGVALTAAPSTARAETGNPIIKDFDKGTMTFRNVATEEQAGNEIVITAEVTVPGTAGRPRTGTVVFSAFMDYSDDGTF